MTKIKDLLEYSLQSGASDLHLSVGSVPMVRIHGIMKKLQLPILELPVMESIKNEVLSDNQKQLFDKNLELWNSSDVVCVFIWKRWDPNKSEDPSNYFFEISNMGAISSRTHEIECY